MFDVLSPDGLSIDPASCYPDLEAAHAAAQAFAQRYAVQGYYWSAQWERIPVEEIAGRCRVVQAMEDE